MPALLAGSGLRASTVRHMAGSSTMPRPAACRGLARGSRQPTAARRAAAHAVREQAAQQQHQQQHHQQQLLDVPTFWARACVLGVVAQPPPAPQNAGPPGARGEPRLARAAAPLAAVALAAGVLALLPPGAARAAVGGADAAATLAALPNPSFDVAENQEFWGNVARYGRYFFTVMLGTGYVMLRPVAGMFKNPVTGVLALLGIAGALYGTKITLDAMLGLGAVPFEPITDRF